MSCEITEEKKLVVGIPIYQQGPRVCIACGAPLGPVRNGHPFYKCPNCPHFAAPDPSEAEIRERCKEIQSTWTWQQEFERRVVKGYARELAELFNKGTCHDDENDAG